jgi:sulfate transport system permease protein
MARRRIRSASPLPGFGLTLGFTTFFLSAVVLLPLAALVIRATGMPLSDLIGVLTDERALASYRLSFGAAFLAAAVNTVFGFIVAWSLVRYDFPGRRLLDAMIDLPFALPTAVSGIALATVFSPTGWLGLKLAAAGVQVAYTWIGVVVALILIGLPFVVRSVQPALIEVRRELEDAPSRWAPAAGTCSVASSCRPCCPRSRPVSRWRSRAASANTARSCSSPATCRSRPRSRRS